MELSVNSLEVIYGLLKKEMVKEESIRCIGAEETIWEVELALKEAKETKKIIFSLDGERITIEDETNSYDFWACERDYVLRQPNRKEIQVTGNSIVNYLRNTEGTLEELKTHWFEV